MNAAPSSSPAGLGLEAAVAAVIAAGARAAARGWTPATAGNFSARIGGAAEGGPIAITRTGVDKGAIGVNDVAALDLAAPDYAGLSAEAPLHVALYRADPARACVWHVHSPAAVVLSRLAEAEGAVRLQGWELQKALAGVTSHEETVALPVLANDQDTHALAERADARLAAPTVGARPAPGYLLAGHGLYAWGRSPDETWRHIEALETLLAHELDLRRSRR